MKGMKFRFGVLALLAIGAVGCQKEEAKNSPSPSVASTNQPALPGTTPDTNIPASNNFPEAANKPVDTNAAPVVTNKPDATKPDANKPDPTKPPPESIKPVIVDPKPAGEAGWTKSQTEARTLVAAADAKMKSVKDMKMSFYIDFAIGKADGYFKDSCLIADQSRYHLNYAEYLPGPNARLESYIVTKQKGGYSTFVSGGYKPGRIEPSKDILKGWALNSTHYITSGVGTKKMPLTELVVAAQKAKWKINVETKKFTAGTYQRIIMESPGAPKRRYELMIEPKKMLPVEFSSAVFEKEKMSSALSIGWFQSDKPLTDDELTPKVKTDQVKVVTAEELAKLKATKKP